MKLFLVTSLFCLIACKTGVNIEKDFIQISEGDYLLGDINNILPENEFTPHTVKLKKFQIQKTEVSQKLWTSIMGYNPSVNLGEQLPVENVSIYEVSKFIIKLNSKSKEKYRLPTNYEWEVACRGANNFDFSFGNKKDFDQKASKYCWYAGNSNGRTHEIGTKQPNHYGIHDMHGNVAEFCLDRNGTLYIAGGSAEKYHLKFPFQLFLTSFSTIEIPETHKDEFTGFRLVKVSAK